MSTHIRSLAILQPHEGQEQAVIALLREFYDYMREQGYSHDCLQHSTQHVSSLVHFRLWADEQKREQAVHDARVLDFWRRISVICEIPIAYEELKPLYNSFDIDFDTALVSEK